MNSNVLPEFQSFLLSNSLVSKKYITFYAHWARKFLMFSRGHKNLAPDLKVGEFLNYLRSQKNISEWQVKQADDAIRLYFNHFLDGKVSSVCAEELKERPGLSKILSDMREAIRIKHYSYRTEQTYIDWTKRFIRYTESIKKKSIHIFGFESKDVRDYLSYLALKKRVSSSTQNQAFNALLFLFQQVLKTELSDLSKTVRAKRGPKLPVVLSIQEVQELFKHVRGTNLLFLQLLYDQYQRGTGAARS
jgi:hypothetical protein